MSKFVIYQEYLQECLNIDYFKSKSCSFPKFLCVFFHPKTLFHFPTSLQLETAPEGSGRWRAYNELLRDNPSAWYSDHKEADLAVASEPMTLIAADAIKGHQNEYGMYGVSGMDDGIPTPLAMAVQARKTFSK